MNEDTLLLVKFLSVFAFVIALMLLFGWVLKKLGAGAGLTGASKKRLKVVEALQVDTHRRLVIVRRDDKEHLLMLGRNSETVVETNIPAAEAEEETVVKFARDQRNVKI